MGVVRAYLSRPPTAESCDVHRVLETGINAYVSQQDGERRKTYSAAVIDGCERTSTIYVGDSIVRKTDRILGKGKDVVVCLPGARIEHVTERVE